ncbi:MAG: hypothetical protein WDO24_30080 [Pseudomonadota bacterium]
MTRLPGATTISDGSSQLEFTAAPGGQYFVRIAFNSQRASFIGLGAAVLGFAPEAHTPESGLFAIEPIEPAKAAIELAGLTLDSALPLTPPRPAVRTRISSSCQPPSGRDPATTEGNAITGRHIGDGEVSGRNARGPGGIHRLGQRQPHAAGRPGELCRALLAVK